MRINLKKQKFGITELFWLLLAVFLVMKVSRAFSGAETKGGLWNVIQLMFMALGFYYLMKKPGILNNRPILFLTLFSFMALVVALPVFRKFTLMGLFDLITIPYGALVLILFYCLGFRTDIKKPTILAWVYYIMAAILIVAMRDFYASGADLDDKGAVADVYYILGLLPLMLLYTKKKWSWLPILVATIAIIFSGKRAGMLALVAMLVVYFFLELKNLKSGSKVFGYLLLTVVGLVLLYFVMAYFDEAYNLRFFDRMESLSSDGGSGRNVIWGRLWSKFKTFDFLEIFAGRGKGSVRRDVGIEAHNDFLHLVYENGVIAVFLYICFHVSLYVQAVKMFRSKYPLARYFLMSVLFTTFIAMFSFYVIDPSYITCGMLCAGLFMADYKKFKDNPTSERIESNGNIGNR